MLDLIKWAWKLFWPLIILGSFIGVHVWAFTALDFDLMLVNKSISLLAQGVGGSLILYAINYNLRTDNNKNLWSLFVDSLKQCPVYNRAPRINQSQPVSAVLPKAEMASSYKQQNVDEEIKDIQKLIDELKSDIKENAEAPNLSKIDSTRINGSKTGASILMFGLLLMIYGAIAGHFA